MYSFLSYDYKTRVDINNKHRKFHACRITEPWTWSGGHSNLRKTKFPSAPYQNPQLYLIVLKVLTIDSSCSLFFCQA